LFALHNLREGLAMKNVLLVGGGKIGVAITEFLSDCGDYSITVADRDAASLSRMPEKNVTRRQVEIGDAGNFADVVKGQDIVLRDALQSDRDGRRGRQEGRRALSRSHRRRGIHAHHPRARQGRRHGLHSAMRPCTGIHLHRGRRSRQEVR